LAFFLLVHVSAVLAGRAFFSLDTNFFFGAAAFHVWPFGFFFAPYYWLGVFAFFAHVGCVAYFLSRGVNRRRANVVLIFTLSLGGLVATLLVLSLAGALAPFTVPPAYVAPFGAR